jgi:hypothetical protein
VKRIYWHNSAIISAIITKEHCVRRGWSVLKILKLIVRRFSKLFEMKKLLEKQFFSNSYFLQQEISDPNGSSYATVGTFEFSDILTLMGHDSHSHVIL